MKTIGDGVRELRITDPSGAFRIIYLARLADRVLVLHAFRKTSQKTQKADLDLATRRLREWKNDHDRRNL